MRTCVHGGGRGVLAQSGWGGGGVGDMPSRWKQYTSRRINTYTHNALHSIYVVIFFLIESGEFILLLNSLRSRQKKLRYFRGMISEQKKVFCLQVNLVLIC